MGRKDKMEQVRRPAKITHISLLSGNKAGRGKISVLFFTDFYLFFFAFLCNEIKLLSSIMFNNKKFQLQ